MIRRTAIAAFATLFLALPAIAEGSSVSRTAQAISSSAVADYLVKLNNAALDQKSFGYFDYLSHTDVTMGFVGPVPSEVRALLTDAPESAHVRVARSVYTKAQMDAASHRTFDSPYGVDRVGRLPKGRGLIVYSNARKLLRSSAPMKLLKVHVGVIVKRD